MLLRIVNFDAFIVSDPIRPREKSAGFSKQKRVRLAGADQKRKTLPSGEGKLGSGP
jgi:hypothetical protein